MAPPSTRQTERNKYMIVSMEINIFIVKPSPDNSYLVQKILGQKQGLR